MRAVAGRLKSEGVESNFIGTMLGATVPSSPFARNYPANRLRRFERPGGLPRAGKNRPGALRLKSEPGGGVDLVSDFAT